MCVFVLFEIALAVYGLISMIRGRMVLTSSKVVRGPLAYFLGIMAMCPMAIVWIGGFAYGFMLGVQGRQDVIQKNKVIINVIEIAVVVGFSIVVFVTAAVFGTKPKKKKRRRARVKEEEDWEDTTDDEVRSKRRRDDYEEVEDDDEDRPHKKNREVYDFEKDEDEPPRRRRHLDEEDEEDERPRRRHREEEDESHEDDQTGKRRRSWER